jgi:ComF family protein
MKTLAVHIVNFFFPPQCLSCNVIVPKHGALCTTCWHKVRFISAPMCECCGLPFSLADAGPRCAECLHTPPAFARARSALVYDDGSSILITRFKYSDLPQFGEVYGQWVAHAARELVSESDVVIPVPLHLWRFVSRRYNQSAIIALALAKTTGLPTWLEGLTRTRPTAHQTGLSRKERANNVRGAFIVTPKYQEQIRGKNVLLVDDVYTTGATLNACATALLKAGALRVNVATLARRTSE